MKDFWKKPGFYAILFAAAFVMYIAYNESEKKRIKKEIATINTQLGSASRMSEEEMNKLLLRKRALLKQLL